MKNLGLYIIIDPNNIGKADLYNLAKEIIEAVADTIQLRNKKSGDKEMIVQANLIKALCDANDTIFIINDRVNVAIETKPDTGTWTVKSGLAQTLKGGGIMDVVTPDQAKIAEDAGAVAVMALERVPSDIRKVGGVARMSDPKMIKEIISSVSIPVMAKCRIGHLAEAQILQHLGVDYADESEVLTPADNNFHINKWDFNMPFVCGATDLGEALRRINEGAAMIRTKGEPGTGSPKPPPSGTAAESEGDARSGVPIGRSPPPNPPRPPRDPITDSITLDLTPSMMDARLTYTYNPLPTTAPDTAKDARASTFTIFCILDNLILCIVIK